MMMTVEVLLYLTISLTLGLLVLFIVQRRTISRISRETDSLRVNETQFREAATLARLGYWEYNPQKGDLYISDEIFSIYGPFPVKNLNIGRLILRHTHADDRKNLLLSYRKVLSDAGIQKIDHRIVSPDGKLKYIRHIFKSQIQNGRAVRLFGIVIDITDQKSSFEEALNTRLNLEKLVDSRTQDLENSRKAAINLLLDANEQRERAENALRQLEESHSEILKLSQAVEQSLAAVAITNFEGEVEYVNHTFEEYSGYLKDEILGYKLDLISTDESAEGIYNQIWNVLRNGESWKGEFHNRHKSGRLYWESVVISPIFNEKKEIVHFVKVSQDITSRKKLEKDLIEARDKADQATRAKSEFLANVSHEIRTPMNAILGFADLLTYTLKDNKSLDYLNSLKISGKNLLSLINDILDLSKVEAGMLKISRDYVNYRQLLKEIEQIFYFKTAEKGLRLNFNLPANFPNYIYVDETRLRQVLLNLVSNAVKYTDTGTIQVDTEISYPSSTNNNENAKIDLIIRVSDTGIGISETFQKIIFQSFTQEEGHDRRKHGGTGLGLAITKKLVELLDGDISLVSQPGNGSTFILHFRGVSVSNDQYAKPLHSSLNWQDIRFGRSRVMIVDDVEDNLKFLGQMLEYAGIQTVTANNGEQAIEMINQELPDLVITDIRMPGMDGFELFGRLRQSDHTARIPVIASSASVLNDDSTEEWLSRFDGYLLKPIQASELIENLMRFLPYQLNATETGHPASPKKSMESGQITVPQEASQILNEIAMDLWKQIRERQPIKKVEEFGNLLVDTGQKYDIEKLVSYGNEILQSRRSFNIEGMVRLIREFPDLVGQLTKSVSHE
ncbi:protein containing PAS domain S-box [Bacteroidales bacterium 6E]|nr:protein containing PAS domain S-box [Bacteroidales bacterium 6E]